MDSSSSELKSSTSRSTRGLDVIMSKYRTAVEESLSKLHPEESQLSRIATYAVSSGGKRIRPVLALMVCEAICGEYDIAVSVATAYELAHSASLIQDDIIDDSALRHDAETVHKRYGSVKAILISDILLFDIFGEFSKYANIKISKKRLAMLLSHLSNAAKLTAEGELLDTTLAKEENITVEDYLRVAGLKTGSLFAASAASGAIVAGGSTFVIDAMYQFGYNLGVAFQIRDDILDMSADSQTIGKPVLKDVQNNATNIVLIHALSNADPYKRHMINSLMFRKWFSRSEVEQLIFVLEQLGSFENANILADRYASQSMELLNCLPKNRASENLRSLTRALESRRE